MDDTSVIEFEDDELPAGAADWSPVPRARVGLLPIAVGLVLALLVGWWVISRDEAEPDAAAAPASGAPDDPVRQGAARSAEQVPPPLLAAELYAADPGADALRALLDAIGGLEGAVVATATGSFDVVSFDPADPDRLLAMHRSSYGAAENQGLNQEWGVHGGEVAQTPWLPDTEHDYALFSRDGSTTMWVHGGGAGFAPRRAQVRTGGGSVLSPTAAVYASRSATVGDTVFALTGDGDYYSSRETFVDVVALRDDRVTVLGDAEPYGAIDNPTPGLVVAYPLTLDGATAVWDATTLQPEPDHPLHGLHYERIAVSGDGSRALAVSFDGSLHPVDLRTNGIGQPFGALDPTGIERPIALNHDGSIAVTVDRDGTVTLWWVDDGSRIAAVAGESAAPRWVPERLGNRSASVVGPDATRLARKLPAAPGVAATWQIIDLDVERWLALACGLAGRPMTPAERVGVGLDGVAPACLSDR